MNKYKVNIPVGKKGNAEIKKFTVDRVDLHSQMRGRGVPFGEYTKLLINGCLVMSDTPAEINDHIEFIYQAKGNILIAGLGIGMVLNAVAQNPEVEHITVVELSEDVIDLVWPHYKNIYGDKIEIVKDNILTWKPPKNAYYNYAWYDIWPDICADNLIEMKRLHRRFGHITHWQGSWCRWMCERQNKRGY